MKKFLAMLMTMVMIAAVIPATDICAGGYEQTAFYLTEYSSTENELVVDLYMHDVAELGIFGFAFLMEHSDNVDLVESKALYFNQNGKTPITFSQNVSVYPYMILGVSLGFPKTETAMARFTFDTSRVSDGEEINISLTIEPENGIIDMFDNNLKDLVIVEGLTVGTITAPSEPTIVYGDSNNDGIVDLTDVVLALKYLASWSGIELNTEASDVNVDNNVDLTDVTMILQHIAGWNTVRLGHNDTVLVTQRATCEKEGEMVLVCNVCDSTQTITTNKISCIYEKTVIEEGSCTKDSEVKYTCSMCGDSYTETVKCLGYHPGWTAKYWSSGMSAGMSIVCAVCGSPAPAGTMFSG